MLHKIGIVLVFARIGCYCGIVYCYSRRWCDGAVDVDVLVVDADVTDCVIGGRLIVVRDSSVDVSKDDVEVFSVVCDEGDAVTNVGRLLISDVNVGFERRD
jgi:hypothetical protein